MSRAVGRTTTLGFVEVRQAVGETLNQHAMMQQRHHHREQGGLLTTMQ